MAEWVLTDLGYLNLDHVLLIRYGDPALKEVGQQFVQLVDGRSMMVVIQGDPGTLPPVPAPLVVPPETEP